MMKSISEVFTLFNDPSTIKKLAVLDKWEAMTDDARNSDDFGGRVEEFLVLGKKYRFTIEEIDDE